jgi:predicted DNA-binding mobile mystery protein A
LEALEKAAQAMGCNLVYALVPSQSLENIVDQKASEAAARMLRSVSHSMKLEKQELTAEANNAQLKNLTQELKAKLDPTLWEKTR